MLRKDAKIELLRRVPLFSECSKSQLAEVALITDEIDLPAESAARHLLLLLRTG